MPPTFDIWAVSPRKTTQSEYVRNLALSFQQAFIGLGYGSRVITNPSLLDGPAVALGVHHRVAEAILLPHLVVYNLELIGPDLETRIPGYLDLLLGCPVWDHNPANVDALRALGVNAAWCDTPTPATIQKALLSLPRWYERAVDDRDLFARIRVTEDPGA